MGIFDRFSERIEGFLDEVFIPEDLRSLLGRASQLIERGNYEQALSLLERARREHEDHHRTYHLLGLCHFFRGEYEEALETIEEAIELRDEPASRLYAGLAAERLGAARDAKLHFQEALTATESPPFEFDLHFGHGRVLLELGRPEKAVHELRKAERLEPDDPELALELARALVECGDLEEAGRRLDEIGERELGAAGAALRARIAEEHGAYDRAANCFERALDEVPDDARFLTGAARAHLLAGAPAKAQQYLLQVLDQTDDPDALLAARVLLGRAKEKVGDLESAREFFEAATEPLGDRERLGREGDEAAEARLGLGRTAVEQGDLETAEAQFERLVLSAPPSVRAQARLGLARCRLEAGLYSEARRLLEDLDADQLDEQLRAERQHLAGRAALGSGDAAEALVALQEALHWVEAPAARKAIEKTRLAALRELKPDWDLPEAIDGPIAAEDVLGETLEFLNDAPRLEEFIPRVRELDEAMSQPLSVAIVGEFNAGKSTLVNALLGEEVVPTGVLPTTAHTCYIRYGPRKTARVHYREERSDTWPPEESPGEVVEVDFAEARRRMEEHTEQIDHLAFLYPHPQLRSIHFRDTPGFNALDGDHDDTAAAALDDAEAVLWVFDAKQTLSRTEFDRLTEIPESADRLVVLLNKVDELAAPEIEELEEYVDDTIGAQIAGAFAISARDAFEARRDPAEGDAPGDERFSAFRDFLDRRFVQRAGHIKTLEARRQLRTIVGDMRRRADAIVDEYGALLDRAEELEEWLEELSDSRPEERAEREASTVSDQFQFAVTAVAREIREDLRPRGTFFSTMVLDREDRAFALELFVERLTDVLLRSEQRVEADVAAFENELDARLGPVLDALTVPNARSLNRRLDGLHEEFGALRRLLTERVYGQLAARIRGRVDAAGDDALSDVDTQDPEDLTPWRDPLEQLLPDAADHVDEHLTDWYREFFLAARRFSDRVQRDLQLLRLEAEYRYETSPLWKLVSNP